MKAYSKVGHFVWLRRKQLAMISDKTSGRDPDAFADDEPTAELPVPTGASVAATEALHDDFDESRSTARAELEAHVQICELQSEIERLRSDAIKLGSENRAVKKLSDEIADELEEAMRKNAELSALLSQRDDELAALKSTLPATDEAAEDCDGLVEVAAEETQSPVPSQRDFETGETRKLVGHGDHSMREIELRPGRISLGSALDNDVSINADFISRHHVQILSGSRETILRDMNSTNGTHVNSRKISRCALRDGDLITIGKLKFTFVKQRSAASDSHPVAPTPTPQDSAHLDPGSWQ